MVVAEARMRILVVVVQAGGTYGGGFGFQERLGWLLQLGL